MPASAVAFCLPDDFWRIFYAKAVFLPRFNTKVAFVKRTTKTVSSAIFQDSFTTLFITTGNLPYQPQ
jgi:hypothetical protein